MNDSLDYYTEFDDFTDDNKTFGCLLFPDEPTKCIIIVVLKDIAASLSLIGCLFVLMTIILFKRYHFFTQRLVLYLTIAALLNTLAYLITHPIQDGHWCNFEGFFLTYTDWSVLLWVLCLVVNLFINAVRHENTYNLEWFYLFVCFIIPGLMALLPIIGDNYGPAGAWCWVISTGWRFAIWYIPLLLAVAIMFILYAYVILSVRHMLTSWQGIYDADAQAKKEFYENEIKPLRGYPFIYLALCVFPLINRIQNAFEPDDPVLILYILTVLSSPMVGSFNAMAYGLDPETRKRLNWFDIRMALRSRRRTTTIDEYPVVEEHSGDEFVNQ